MSTVSEIQADILRAHGMLSDLANEYRSDLKAGCEDCEVKNLECLDQIVNALQYQIDKGYVTDIAEGLYNEMLLILGNYQFAGPPITSYNLPFGFTPVQPSDVNVTDFVLQFTKQVPIGSTQVLLNFTTGSINNYLIARVPITEPLWVTWFNDIFSNSGNIPDEKWTSVVISSYRYYYTRLPLSLDIANPVIKFNS